MTRSRGLAAFALWMTLGSQAEIAAAGEKPTVDQLIALAAVIRSGEKFQSIDISYASQIINSEDRGQRTDHKAFQGFNFWSVLCPLSSEFNSWRPYQGTSNARKKDST